jgi:hypothetical protein
MTMTLARWLLTRTTVADSREALVGDLLEEIAGGRSSLWVCQELVGLYAFALIAQARQSVRITPLFIALVLGLVLVGGTSMTSIGQMVQTWTSVYYIAGMASLFAHVMSRSTASRTLPIAEEIDGSPGRT